MLVLFDSVLIPRDYLHFVNIWEVKRSCWGKQRIHFVMWGKQRIHIAMWGKQRIHIVMWSVI